MIIIYVFNYIIWLIENKGLSMTDTRCNIMSTAVHLSDNYYYLVIVGRNQKIETGSNIIVFRL